MSMSKEGGLQWRRVDDRLVSMCLRITERVLIKGDNQDLMYQDIIDDMKRFGPTVTNTDQDAIHNFQAWKTHIIDRIKEEYDKNGWEDEYEEEEKHNGTYHLHVHKEHRPPSPTQIQELKDSIEYYEREHLSKEWRS